MTVFVIEDPPKHDAPVVVSLKKDAGSSGNVRIYLNGVCHAYVGVYEGNLWVPPVPESDRIEGVPYTEHGRWQTGGDS